MLADRPRLRVAKTTGYFRIILKSWEVWRAKSHLYLNRVNFIIDVIMIDISPGFHLFYIQIHYLFLNCECTNVLSSGSVHCEFCPCKNPQKYCGLAHCQLLNQPGRTIREIARVFSPPLNVSSLPKTITWILLKENICVIIEDTKIDFSKQRMRNMKLQIFFHNWIFFNT